MPRLWEVEGELGAGVLHEQPFAEHLLDDLGVHGHGDVDAELVTDASVLAEEHLEDEAIDGVVFAIIGQGADGLAALAIAVDAALALLVAGGVPGEVVVDHGVEEVLEVDALGEAVGADEDAAGVLLEGGIQVGDVGVVVLVVVQAHGLLVYVGL